MISKQQIIRTLMLSPYYFSLSLAERQVVIGKLSVKYGAEQDKKPDRPRRSKTRK
jgi:hypothetical protein